MKECTKCRKAFEITEDELSYLERISPVFDGRQYPIPPPERCPDCRRQQRLIWRNERALYRRTSDLSQAPVISVYHPEAPFTVYSNAEWRDRSTWNPLDYGRDYDSSRPFFEQLRELQLSVPRRASNIHLDSENSDYSNQAWHVKNCYLCINTGYSEDCFYCLEVYFSKDIVDCIDMKNSELCYRCFNCNHCYTTYFSEKCVNCTDTWFSIDCRGCRDVILCSNLRNKEYCFLNQPCSKEEFLEKKKELLRGRHTVIQSYLESFKRIKSEAIYKENSNSQVENCLGDYLIECKGCTHCYSAYRSEDCQYVYQADNDVKDCRHMNYCAELELSYEGNAVAGYRNHFCYMTVHGNDCLYCDSVQFCEHCFGCVALERNSHCILNKQYTKKDYQTLVGKIIEQMRANGEWGGYFPPSLCPFGYNESVALPYFPLSREQALEQGFPWSDFEAPSPEVGKVIQAEELPDSIHKTTDLVLGWGIACEVTGKPFRITKQELQFHRDHSLPLPRRHPDVRYDDKMALRNLPRLWKRRCAKTGVEILTTYPPDGPKNVYCEEAYEKAIYG